ncbi:MAG: hypothetical protein OXP66_02880, partial [Candidatus Tectomicrobia bacterium]|nr:hypothetical protein [Candidatus Tectomicrobia bacterium]
MHQRITHSRFTLLALVGLLCLCIFGQSDTIRATVSGFVLFSEEDAGDLRLTEAEVVEGVRLEAETRGKHAGPHIVLETPEVIEGVVLATTPIDLSLTFEPNLAPV